MSSTIARYMPLLTIVLIVSSGLTGLSNLVHQSSCCGAEVVDAASSHSDPSESTSHAFCSSLWEISTRGIESNNCILGAAGEMGTSQFVAGIWEAASESQLVAELSSQPAWTVLFVHGNRTSLEMSRCHSRAIFESLRQRTVRPIRVISLSWPSEKPKPLLLPSALVEEKKELIRSTGIRLADFLERLEGDAIQAMVGFSFGSAIIACALHLHNGGQICGICTPVQFPSRQKEISDSHCRCLRVGFIAPAMDRCALRSGGEYSRALESIGQLVNLYNSRDPILRRFRFFDRDNPIAAGYAGLLDTQYQPLAVSTRFQQFDCRAIGASHALADYCRCSAYEELLANILGQTVSLTGEIPALSP